ncbi:hypothetical protein DL546_003181 [Coniochaeta pulveracea]|uniref:Uncharacterized protein n=1 Tax=Coniochaeta pulveracea TaxID=177199 RepID=A0A420Y231_9PEZI|nr:hypothetical protein DL546_003181 [Coniochaeta pulveracea]
MSGRPSTISGRCYFQPIVRVLFMGCVMTDRHRCDLNGRWKQSVTVSHPGVKLIRYDGPIERSFRPLIFREKCVSLQAKVALLVGQNLRLMREGGEVDHAGTGNSSRRSQ